MDYSKYLNEEQLRGVTCPNQYIKVVAGAGSGKTRVLTYRIVYLLDQMHARESEILGITFTNKAAKEIKERVLSLVPDITNMALSTIHSWCARFLRYHIDVLGYAKNFTILDEEDQTAVMRTIFVNHGRAKNDPDIKNCIYWISSKKTEGLQYKDIANQEFYNSQLKLFKEYFKEYDEYLRKIGSLDFDDLMLKTIEILETYPDIRTSTNRRIRYILVDEFQDINDVQFYLIRLLMNKDTYLYVVGDPDQTIYTWRGANNRIMINLEESLKADYPTAKVEEIFLKNNYRSSKNILDAANKLIDFNKERIKKELIPINPEGEDIVFYNARNSEEEASYIAKAITEGVKENGKKYSDFAILYRANFLTRALEAQMNLNRIPYKIFGGLKFFQRKEIKDVLAYFTLFVNADNDVSFERIINVPKRNIGPTSIEVLKNEADNNSQTLYMYVLENLHESSLPAKKRLELEKMVNQIEETKLKITNAKGVDIPDIAETFLTEIKYFEFLEEDEKGDERIENVKELIGTIREFYRINPDATFDDFIENTVLQAGQDEINNGDFVSLMTVHTAKGLEFNTVFIYGFNEGVFPSARSIAESEKGEEEERRLAYVALTRAKKKLYVTCNQDFSYVVQSTLKPSRFLKEAGLKVTSSYFEEMMKDYQPSLAKSTYHNSSYGNYKKPSQPAVNPNATNGITDWKVGDTLMHEVFGRGIVTKIVSDRIFEVKFDDELYGTKTMLSSHIKIKRLLS